MSKYIVLLLLLWTVQVGSQELSLEECIDIAREANIDLKNTLLTYKDASIDLKQAKSNRLPDLNVNYNVGQNYGRSIDPFTNDYVNQQLTFSNIQANSSLLLYNGFALKHQIQSTKYGQQAAEMEMKEVEDQLAILVTRAFYQALNARVNLGLSQQSAEATKARLDQVQKEYDLGSGDPATLSDFKGQYASDQLRIIDARNVLKQAKLELFQLMNQPYSEGITLAEVSPETGVGDYTVKEVYAAALQNFQAFRARDLRINEARSFLDQQQSALLPSVFLFAGVNSNYSSAARRLNVDGMSESETGDFVRIENVEIPVLERANDFSASTINYGNQLFENISPNFGISVRYPIFNQNIQRNRVSKAQLAVSMAEVEKEGLAIEFKQVIETAILTYDNLRDRIMLLESQVAAYEESFRINEVKLENGVSNRIEYIISKNNLDSARLGLANARFSILIQKAIIEFYSS